VCVLYSNLIIIIIRKRLILSQNTTSVISLRTRYTSVLRQVLSFFQLPSRSRHRDIWQRKHAFQKIWDQAIPRPTSAPFLSPPARRRQRRHHHTPTHQIDSTNFRQSIQLVFLGPVSDRRERALFPTQSIIFYLLALTKFWFGSIVPLTLGRTRKYARKMRIINVLALLSLNQLLDWYYLI